MSGWGQISTIAAKVFSKKNQSTWIKFTRSPVPYRDTLGIACPGMKGGNEFSAQRGDGECDGALNPPCCNNGSYHR